MKYFGDIPQIHLNLIEELETLEEWFNSEGASISKLGAAKGHTCMAHDYYRMSMEEEGKRLLNIAEKLHPGYFRGPIWDHASTDSEFKVLVFNLMKDEFSLKDMQSLGLENE